MRTSTKAIRCASCKKPIPDHEPDVVLQRTDTTDEVVFFHERCAAGAFAMVIIEPAVWIMTVRHVGHEPSRN